MKAQSGETTVSFDLTCAVSEAERIYEDEVPQAADNKECMQEEIIWHHKKKPG